VDLQASISRWILHSVAKTTFAQETSVVALHPDRQPPSQFLGKVLTWRCSRNRCIWRAIKLCTSRTLCRVCARSTSSCLAACRSQPNGEPVHLALCCLRWQPHIR